MFADLGTLILVGGGLVVLAFILGLVTLKHLIYICPPSEVLIFSGRTHQVDDRTRGYRLIKGGQGFRLPLVERVDSLDLTNMVIDLTAQNAFSKGGVALTVQGVANVKIAGHEPLLDHAIERFLGMEREQIAKIAKATLEGSLRGVLALMTPEEINDDRIKFATSLVHEVEHDMSALGLTVDTLKIQNVHDELGYLDSIGRIRNADIIRKARVAEAIAKADAAVRNAENRGREVKAKVTAAISVAKAESEKLMTETLTQREALVAEENATVSAAVARAEANIGVQIARVQQVKKQLEADVILPAMAACEAAISRAKADAAPIVEDGRARADVLTTLASSWAQAGPNARKIFLMQKLDKVIEVFTRAISDAKVDQLTIIDSRTPNVTDDRQLPLKALSSLEQVRQIFGVDLLDALKKRQSAS